MYVYIESEHHATGSLWTVGFYDPKGEWHPESDHDSQLEASKRVAWLNGGCENCSLRLSVDQALNSGDGVYRP